jgi:hypothetical protein
MIMDNLNRKHSLAVEHFPVGKLLNVLVLISLLLSNLGVSQAEAKSPQIAQNPPVIKKSSAVNSVFEHPSPRVGIRPSTSSTNLNQVRDSFDLLECGAAPAGATCEIIEAGKHLRFTSTITGFNGPYGFDFYAHALPSNLDMPVSWRAVISHSETGGYPQNRIIDHLTFYAITGSTYFSNQIATTPPGYYVNYDNLVIEWEGLARTADPWKNFVWAFGKDTDWPTSDAWEIQIDFYYGSLPNKDVDFPLISSMVIQENQIVAFQICRLFQARVEIQLTHEPVDFHSEQWIYPYPHRLGI